MKKLYIILPLFVLSGVLLSFQDAITSNGAPLASTGAPLEQTCAKSTCHNDHVINSGAGILNLDFNNGLAQYEPGRTYHITVSLSQDSINRFGFQMEALKNSDNTQAGTLIITDSVRTQILTGVNQYTGRNYVTYKFEGTNPYAANLGQWGFDWVAPATDQGTIIFYYAGVAANNDGTDMGDLVYIKQLTLQSTVASIKENDNTTSQVNIFPNPAKDVLSVNYAVEEPGNTAIILNDILSRKNYTLLQRFDDAGMQTAKINIQNKFSSGVYLLSVVSGTKTVTKKVVIQ